MYIYIIYDIYIFIYYIYNIYIYIYISQYSEENNLILNNVTGLQVCSFRCFPVNIAQFLRTTTLNL